MNERAAEAELRHCLGMVQCGAWPRRLFMARVAQLGVAPLGTVDADLHAVPLTTVGQVLVVPRAHPLAARKTVRLRDLKDAQLIVPPAGKPHRELLGRLLQAEHVAWTPSLEANGWELMLRFAQLGFGLTVVNACCRIPAGLVAIPLTGYPPLGYHVFHAADRPPTAHVRQVMAMLLVHGDQWQAGARKTRQRDNP